MSQESQTYVRRLRKANARERFNPAKDLVYTRIALAGVITQSSLTAADLTASGALKSRGIADRLGITLPSADPSVVLIIDRVGFDIHAGVETDLIVKSLAREAYLKHTPANDRSFTVDLGGYLTSATRSNGSGVIATGAFGNSAYKAETYDLEVPMVVDLERDALEVAPLTAVATAGATCPFTLWADVWAFHNRGFVRSEFVRDLGEGDEDQARIVMERAKGNAMRQLRYGKPASATAIRGGK